jgi:hypothetical protein
MLGVLLRNRRSTDERPDCTTHSRSSADRLVIAPAYCRRPPVSRPAPANATAPTDGRPEQPGAAGGTLERHPELPGNTASCELPGPFALVSGDAKDGGDVTAHHRRPPRAGVMACSLAASATPRRTRPGSRRCSTASSRRCSTGYLTRPGSSRVTAATPRSARSARTWPSGANAAGNRRLLPSFSPNRSRPLFLSAEGQ